MISGRLSLLLLFFAGIASLVPASACAGDLQLRDVEIGIANRFKLGRWTPVRFTLQTGEHAWQGGIQISARDGDDAWATYTGGNLEQISLPANSSRRIETYVRIGRQESSLRIEGIPSETGGERFTQYIALPTTILTSQHAILVVGGDIGLRSAIRIIPRQPSEEIIGETIEDVSQLPSHWYGYESFDLLILTTADDSLYENLTDQQRKAISDWVALGGRLMVTVGANGQEYLEQPTLISRFAPGQFQRTLPLHDVSVLENYSEANMSLEEGESPADRLPPLVTQLADVTGEIQLAQGRDLPLVIRAAHGMGVVIFVAMDLDTPPISDWEDGNRLVAKLLELCFSETAFSDSRPQSSEAAQLGFDDLSGQVHSALQVFKGVTLLNFSTVAALIVIYVALIGPLDFWLVRVVLKRPELTWITSAALVVVFCGLAWWLAGRVRGDTPRMNQIDIVDIDADQRLARGVSWLHLYSPTSRNFDLALEPEGIPLATGTTPNVLLSWQGSPGDSFGGMNRQSRIDHDGAEYLLPNNSAPKESANVSVRELPLPAAGAKALSARWWGRTDPLEDYELREIQGKRLVGYFKNPLSVPLTNCWLYHDRWVYQIGNLAPGQRVDLNTSEEPGKSPRDSERTLTERRVIDGTDVASPWDQAMRDDVPRIVRMMMFHEVAQGRNHTNLLHRQYGYLDMSHHLDLDRAILVGMSEKPATQITSGGEPLEFSDNQRWTFYRIVFPTQPVE